MLLRERERKKEREGGREHYARAGKKEEGGRERAGDFTSKKPNNFSSFCNFAFFRISIFLRHDYQWRRWRREKGEGDEIETEGSIKVVARVRCQKEEKESERERAS